MHRPRPVLIVDNSRHLLSLIAHCLSADHSNRPLLVLPQHQHVRQYLTDAIRVGRHPVLIVLRASAEPLNDPSRTLLHWLRDQAGELCAIPVLMLSGVCATVLETPFTMLADEGNRAQISAGIARALRQHARST
jgi:hypothetical protein